MPATSQPPGRTGGAFARFGAVRPVSDRKVAGVCAALGRATGTDALLWRVVLAVLVVFAGAGLVLYALGWVLIPAEGDEASALEALVGSSRSSLSRVPTVLLIAAASGMSIVTFNDTEGRPFLVFAALVLLLGALSRRTAAPSEPPVSGYPPPVPDHPVSFPPAEPFANGRVNPNPTLRLPADTYPTPPDTTVRLPAAEVPVEAPVTAPPMTGAPMPSPVTAPPYWVSPPPPAMPPPPAAMPPLHRPPGGAPIPGRRRRSRLGVMTIAGIVSAMSIMSIVAMSGVNVPFGAFVAVALILCGLGLVVGTWWGRSPTLYVLGCLLSIVMVLTMLAQGAGISGIGHDQRIRPDSVAGIPSSVSATAGSTTLDLSGLWIDEDVSLDVSATAGSVTIRVDPAVDVVVIADRVVAGSVDLENQEIAGFRGGDLGSAGADGGGVLTIHAEVVAGSVEVQR